MRTLLDNDSKRPERRTALIGRELARYGIDIAALGETRLADESQLQEVGAGYTFFWIGKPAAEHRQSGTGFAMRSSLVRQLNLVPTGVNDRLMTLRLPLQHGRHATFISAYAPTMTNPEEAKEQFYSELRRTIHSVHPRDKIVLLGDFNARVGRNHNSWERVLGHHGIGKENSNGTMLLSLCSELELVITNTIFQQTNKYKTTWMHPRSKHWHLIDYVITRQRDLKDVRITRAMRGAEGWTDHRLVRCILSLSVDKPSRQRRGKPARRLNVSRLGNPEICSQLEEKMDSVVDGIQMDMTDINTDANWVKLRDATYNAAAEVLGHVERKHQDWFDEGDVEMAPLLTSMHNAHKAWICDKNSASKKSTYNRLKQEVQAKTREMKNKWWKEKSRELQEAADHRDIKRFFDGLKAIYGPKCGGLAPLRTADGDTLLTNKDDVLKRWAEHFNNLLNRPSTVDNAAIDEIPQHPMQEQLSSPPNLAETIKAIKQMSNGKAPGADGIPAEVFKYGGQKLARKLLQLFKIIWESETVPQDFKDANIIHLYKRKGDRSNCDNHRGISLLATAGKVLAKILGNRLSSQISENFLPESQCGFRPGRGTVDMIFTARQIQEKCREQHRDLYLVFIDLTKAFDTVSREALWQILHKVGCPDKFVNIVRSFHNGMLARVVDEGIV